jgi:hypothetical protein
MQERERCRAMAWMGESLAGVLWGSWRDRMEEIAGGGGHGRTT